MYKVTDFYKETAMPALKIISREGMRESRRQYDAYIARKALAASHSMVKQLPPSRATIDERLEYNFLNGKQVQSKPKFDLSNPQNRLRLESAVIRAKALERKVTSLGGIADFRKRSSAGASQNAALTPIESAGHQAAVSMRPDISSGAQSKKTQEHPTGDAASCACGQPRGQCGCGTADRRLAPSAVMASPANIVPFSQINRNLVAREGAAMSAMKKQIERGMIGRGF